jgi:exopolyphosphatase/pppGpp-phosphohydrolase
VLTPPRIAAAVDVGSNSVHLLAAIVGDRTLVPILDRSELLGLGDVVDARGGLGPEARAELLAALRRLRSLADSYGAHPITLLGTEPLRRAADASEVAGEVEGGVGLPLHVLSHEAEGELTLLGVTMGVPVRVATLVADIGGGSTEAILAAPVSNPRTSALRVGSARLTASHVRSDPVTRREIEDLRAEAARLVGQMPLGDAREAIFVGGTATNLIRLLPGADDGRLDAARIAAIYERLRREPAAELVAATGVTARRARQLAAGAAIAEALLGHHGLAVASVSAASLREGAIIAVDRGGPRWQERLPALAAGWQSSADAEASADREAPADAAPAVPGLSEG